MATQVLMVAPLRADEQRMQALRAANAIRSARAHIKRDVKAGNRTLASVLKESPVEVETMRVYDLLVSAPKIGRVKANKILVRCGITPSKTIGALSRRQATVIIDMVGQR